MPSKDSKLNVVIVGCGNIASKYAEQIQACGSVELLGFSDIAVERAEEFATKFGGRVYPALDEVLSDPSVEIVVNLTIHHAHAEVITRCLEGGKHVHTEKPLAMTYREARNLVALAKEKGLRLSSAPVNLLGEAHQTAWKIIREGKLGTIRLAYAEVNHSRIETWHPNPEPFYEAGILWDVGVYPLTILTAFLGSVRKVCAFGKVIFPDRETSDGISFHIETPDCVFANLEFANGTLVRLTANFYAIGSKQGGALEFLGDSGRLYLGHFQNLDTSVEYGDFGEDYEPVPYVREPIVGTGYGRGIEELANAILHDRPHRAQGEHAAHVVEIIEGIHKAITNGEMVDISSTFTPPAPMDWAL